MVEQTQQGIGRAVDRTFDRLIDSIARVEAEAVRTSRQLQEVHAEVQHTNQQVSGSIVECGTRRAVSRMKHCTEHESCEFRRCWIGGFTLSNQISIHSGLLGFIVALCSRRRQSARDVSRAGVSGLGLDVVAGGDHRERVESARGKEDAGMHALFEDPFVGTGEMSQQELTFQRLPWEVRGPMVFSRSSCCLSGRPVHCRPV